MLGGKCLSSGLPHWLFLSSLQIITVEEAKRRKSTCSYYEEEEEEEEGLPILQPHSALLENMHIEQVGLNTGLRGLGECPLPLA